MTRRTKLATLMGIGMALMLSICSPSPAQEKDKAPAKKIAIRAGRLIDGKSDTPILNALIVIEGDKSVSVTPGGMPPAGVEVVDLSKATVLPGFIDVHTHVLLNGDITAADYDDQLL
jgi:imidazolonepropionase-like amidohydrolase